MKKTQLMAFFLFLNLYLFAQSNTVDVLGSSWSLQQDQMAGLGMHHSLEVGTILNFVKKDQWTASAPIQGFDEGRWEQDKKGRIVLYFGAKKRGFCHLDGAQLVLIVPGLGKERRMIWAKK